MASILKMDEITKGWLKRILQKSMETEDIDVLSINPITHNGFLSKAATAEISIKNGEKKKLFIKFNLPNDNIGYDTVKDFDLDTTEIKAYQDIFPKLIEFEQKVLGYSNFATSIPKASFIKFLRFPICTK